jgi:hypothetical protein
MFELIKKYRREFVYSSYLFLIFELLSTPSFAVNLWYFLAIAIVGYVLINMWLFSTYKLSSIKKASKYSDVILRVNLWERLFSYVFLPLVFYTSVVTFILFSTSNMLTQIVIVVSVALFFYLFLFVRTSYEKVYSMNRMTRVASDFVSIVVYFLLLTVINRVVVDISYFSLILFFLTLFCFVYVLYHHNKFENSSAILAIFSSLAITVTHLAIENRGIYYTPLLLSILYYLVISLWNVRFSGSRALGDYMPPLMFAIMAIILLLSL